MEKCVSAQGSNIVVWEGHVTSERQMNASMGMHNPATHLITTLILKSYITQNYDKAESAPYPQFRIPSLASWQFRNKTKYCNSFGYLFAWLTY